MPPRRRVGRAVAAPQNRAAHVEPSRSLAATATSLWPSCLRCAKRIARTVLANNHGAMQAARCRRATADHSCRYCGHQRSACREVSFLFPFLFEAGPKPVRENADKVRSLVRSSGVCGPCKFWCKPLSMGTIRNRFRTPTSTRRLRPRVPSPTWCKILCFATSLPPNEPSLAGSRHICAGATLTVVRPCPAMTLVFVKPRFGLSAGLSVNFVYL
jgi:hypothetical protein